MSPRSADARSTPPPSTGAMVLPACPVDVTTVRAATPPARSWAGATVAVGVAWLLPSVLIAGGVWAALTAADVDRADLIGPGLVVLAVVLSVLMTWARRRGWRARERELGRCAEAGWYTDDELAALTLPGARRAARRWAARRGAGAQEVAFQRTADALARACRKQRAAVSPGGEGAATGPSDAVRSLLRRSLTARESLRHAVGAGPGGWTSSR